MTVQQQFKQQATLAVSHASQAVNALFRAFVLGLAVIFGGVSDAMVGVDKYLEKESQDRTAVERSDSSSAEVAI